VTDLVSILLAATLLWAGTNIDNLVVLTALFVQSARLDTPRPSQIVLGQYSGSIFLIAISVAAAAGLMIIPDQWVGLLGLVPLGLGIYGFIKAFQYRESPMETAMMGSGSVAAIVIANGGDNISAYTAAFRTFSIERTMITIGTFLVLIAVWCAAARLAATRKKVLIALDSVSRWLVPVVYVTIGTLIIITSGIAFRIASTL